MLTSVTWLACSLSLNACLRPHRDKHAQHVAFRKDPISAPESHGLSGLLRRRTRT